MDQIKILKRAFNITVQYRALWVFGILLALVVGGSGGGSGSSGSRSSSNNNNPNFSPEQFFQELQRKLTPEVINTIIAIGIGLACLILVLTIVSTIVRYVSETSLIRMVDEYENSGEKLTVRQGFRLGWSRAAWNIFVMEFLVGLATLAIFLAALMLAAVPLLVWATPSVPLHVLGTIITIGLALLLIFVMILVSIAIGLLMLFAKRIVILENPGMGAAIRRSYEIVRARLGDVVLMGIIMYGIRLMLAIVLIPVFLAIFIVAALVGGLPALLVGGILSTFMQGATPWIVAAIVGLPLFFVVIFIPSALIGGWEQTFTTTTWTLTYREALALMKLKENAAPVEPATPEIA